MHKLAAIDAQFLYSETERTPNHIASLQILELPKGVSVDELIRRIKRIYMNRMHLFPYLYSRVHEVPGNFDHPVLVADPDFNVNDHIGKVKLRRPGNFRQLEKKIAQLHAGMLDRNRPLWRLCVIYGLENPRQVAYYNCSHHACLDGEAGREIIELLMDPTPEIRQMEVPRDWPPTEEANPERLALDGLLNLMRRQIEAPNALLSAIDSAMHFTRRLLDPDANLASVTRSGPRTRFNTSIERDRAYAAGDFSMSDLNEIKKVVGCSLNDVFLAICSGGLRRYFQRSGDLPATPLIASCPVSLRKPGDQAMNTQVTMMNVDLATDREDPRHRLYRIRKSTTEGKNFVADTRTDFTSDLSFFGLPTFMTASAQVMEMFRVADTAPVQANLVISNVPGPRNVLYSAGARMIAHYPVSVPTHGLGVNITVHSYIDRFYFAITACAKTLPDADVLRDDILDSFRELHDLLVPERPLPRLFERFGNLAPHDQPGTGAAAV